MRGVLSLMRVCGHGTVLLLASNALLPHFQTFWNDICRDMCPARAHSSVPCT